MGGHSNVDYRDRGHRAHSEKHSPAGGQGQKRADGAAGGGGRGGSPPPRPPGGGGGGGAGPPPPPPPPQPRGGGEGGTSRGRPARLSQQVRTTNTTGKIQELRQQVRSGQYRIDARETAARMLLMEEDA